MSDIYTPPSFSTPVDLDLSRNEGRPSIDDLAIAPADMAEAISRYPKTDVLAAALADRYQVPVSRVLVTAGGDDALLRCFLATAGTAAVATTPSFEMIRRYASQVQTPLIEVPWWDGDFPIDGFLAEAWGNPGMAIVVSPNNPTGSVVTSADLRKLADVYPLVVLDAAYAEFADDDLTAEALEMGNVVVVRTLSKAFGLAGLRVGYLLGDDDVVRRLTGYGSPYAVSSLSTSLAVEAVSRRSQDALRFAREVATRRDRLFDLLHELGCVPLPSQGNFVLVTDVDPGWLVPAAAALGVGMRSFPDHPELGRCVRITVPVDKHDFDRLEATLRTVLAPEAVLFDMDGVLADVSRSYRAAIIATAARFGVPITGDDVARAKRAGDASDDWDLTRRLCDVAGVEVSSTAVRQEFERIYHGDGGMGGLNLRERLLVDVSHLETWSRRLPLAVVTARPRADAMAFLDRFGLEKYFSVVVTREDAPLKPDPSPVRFALERLGVERAWMVGDTVDDMRAAKGAGVVPIAVAGRGDERGFLAGAAARVVGSVDELKELLDDTAR